MDDTKARGYAQCLAVVVFVLFVVVGAWDLFAWFQDRPQTTVSVIIRGWSREYLGWAFFAGWLACHLFGG